METMLKNYTEEKQGRQVPLKNNHLMKNLLFLNANLELFLKQWGEINYWGYMGCQ